MTNPDSDIAEIHQFISLVRTFLGGKTSEKLVVNGEAFRLWRAAYGRNRVTGNTVEDLAQEMGNLLSRKIAAASAVALHLTLKVARHEGVEATEILDRIERQIASVRQHEGNEAAG